MVRAVGENSFQPKIGFKTRYGLVANPFAEGTNQGLGALKVNQNRYYRRVAVKNHMRTNGYTLIKRTFGSSFLKLNT